MPHTSPPTMTQYNAATTRKCLSRREEETRAATHAKSIAIMTMMLLLVRGGNRRWKSRTLV